MNCNGLNSAVFEQVANVWSIDRILIPTDSDFSSDRNLVADCFYDLRSGIGEQWAVLEKGRTAVFGNHFVHGATEVEINKVGLFPVDDFLGSLAHPLSIGSEELDADGALFFIEGGVLSGPMVGLHNALGRDEFGDHDISSEFFAQGAKGDIRHAGPRREVDWELILEPR